MIILLHSSKAMRFDPAGQGTLRNPQLQQEAIELDAYLKTLTPSQLVTSMKFSSELAKKTKDLIARWRPDGQTAAIDAFIGDIYSGMQAPSFSPADRAYADKTLLILSGLYGILRPLDGINPYRLEMGYRLPDQKYSNLVKFWGSRIADCLPAAGPVVNLAAVEYSQTVTPYLDLKRIVAPKFLTISPKTSVPSFVTVHAKIARGAFARWMILSKVSTLADLSDFDDIGYKISKRLSTNAAPTFVCKEFGGTGLSIRMQDSP